MLQIIKQRLNALPDRRVTMELARIFSRILPNGENNAVTAFATGGQTNATALREDVSFHEVTTCATAADSVRLPPAVVGAYHFVKNSGAAALQVYGAGTDTIDSVATGTGVSQAPKEGNFYYCVTAGNYISLSGDTSGSAFTSLTGLAATFPITGLAAAQGGSVTLTGGASSTSLNAGGVAALLGGAGGATGAGGAVTATGAAGGATSGTGGAVTLTGGAGTAGNSAGGAANFTSGAGQGSAASGVVTIASGLGGLTGASGAINVTSGAGGATSGVSGAITVASGTTTSGASGAVTIGSGNATGGIPGTTTVQAGAAQTAATAGGAIAVTAGAGNTSGAGGAITITSGAAGSTGVAGAIGIAVGAAVAGNGSAITLTGGNGAGGTASGGNINLIPGTAVSTGVPGEVQVNSAAGFMECGWYQNLAASVPVSGTSYTVFMANRAYRVKAASVICSSTATVPTADVTKDTGTTAPGSGSTVLTGVMTFSGTANTRVAGTLVATVATLTLAAGDRLAVKWAGTVGAITGAMVSILVVPV